MIGDILLAICAGLFVGMNTGILAGFGVRRFSTHSILHDSHYFRNVSLLIVLACIILIGSILTGIFLAA